MVEPHTAFSIDIQVGDMFITNEEALAEAVGCGLSDSGRYGNVTYVDDTEFHICWHQLGSSHTLKYAFSGETPDHDYVHGAIMLSFNYLIKDKHEQLAWLIKHGK